MWSWLSTLLPSEEQTDFWGQTFSQFKVPVSGPWELTALLTFSKYLHSNMINWMAAWRVVFHCLTSGSAPRGTQKRSVGHTSSGSVPRVIGWGRAKPQKCRWGGSDSSSAEVREWKGDNIQELEVTDRCTGWQVCSEWRAAKGDALVCLWSLCRRSRGLTAACAWEPAAPESWPWFCSEAAGKFSFLSVFHKTVIKIIICIRAIWWGSQCHCSSLTTGICWPLFVPRVSRCLPRWQVWGFTLFLLMP